MEEFLVSGVSPEPVSGEGKGEEVKRSSMASGTASLQLSSDKLRPA